MKLITGTIGTEPFGDFFTQYLVKLQNLPLRNEITATNLALKVTQSVLRDCDVSRSSGWQCRKQASGLGKPFGLIQQSPS